MGRAGDIGKRKSSIWLRLGMVFLMVRERGQKQGIWTGNVGKQNSSIWTRLDMVFRKVRAGGRKQGIWAGRRREPKIIDLDTFRYGFP